ncbi:MAG: hypothetical protein WC285_06565, partial [Candidatus Gracilibacteria bacterium]
MAESGKLAFEGFGAGIESLQAIPRSGSGVHNRAILERNNLMCGIDGSWDDEHVLKFVQKYPEVMKQHAVKMRDVSCMNRSAPGYISAKAELFGNIIGNLGWRITAEHKRENFIEHIRGKKTIEPKRRIREKINDYEAFKGSLILLKKAYERFAEDRVELERNLLAGINNEKVRVPENFPYVMVVNKGVNKQYAVVYKYDKSANKVVFQACNVVSTGAENR